MINEILEKVREVISGEYPDKTVLPDPSTLENNPTIYLSDGYSVSLGPGAEETLGYKVATTYNREIIVSITKQINDSELTATSRHAVEKNLIDERNNIIKLVKTTPDVLELALGVKYLSDTGINFLEAEKSKFLEITMTFEFIYNEFY